MGMRQDNLLETVTLQSHRVWNKLRAQNPELRGFRCPAVKLNGRLYRTAGRCYQTLDVVEFGTQFFAHSLEFYTKMMRIVVPHELIHSADFYLHGESEKKCGHGRTWQRLMVEYGIPADKLHDMWIVK
jgi:predicted SprT family Zn-dependent metalloprotease